MPFLAKINYLLSLLSLQSKSHHHEINPNYAMKSALALFATACLTVVAAPLRPFYESRVIVSSDTKDYYKNAYPTVAALPDGRLLLTWTAFDHTEKWGRIVAAFSTDDGRSWTKPETIIDTGNGMGDYDPAIVITPTEMQVYSTTTAQPLRLIDHSEMWKVSRKFDDRHWGKAVKMPAHHRYECGRIHIGVTLPDGTLLMPYSWDILAEEGHPVRSEGEMKLKSAVLRSTDGGQTWESSGEIFAETPKRSSFATAGMAEPSLVALTNGELYSLLRTSDIWHYETRSRDGGLTWDKPTPSPLTGHNTPSALWRLKHSNDVLVVWNNAPVDRWPLAVALSTDGCRNWSKPRNLADTAGIEASYPTATQAQDGMLIVVWQQQLSDKKRRELRIARFNRDWLTASSLADR